MNTLQKIASKGCKLCPRECGIIREEFRGLCGCKNELEIASYNLHFGEEPPISGKNGSGAIFFAGCNMSCVYCQNYPISQLKSAYRQISPLELSDIMLSLQTKKAHNINLVTPSHFAHLICESIDIAKTKGLSIPIVYNTSSYDKIETIEYLKNYIDIYIADLKYSDNSLAKQLSGIDNYFHIATQAILAMYDTKGRLKIEDGIAKQGIIIRHLVLPGYFNNTKNVLKWLNNNIPTVHLSLMSQYFPVHKAFSYKNINRKLNSREYNDILSLLDTMKNIDGFIQDFE